MNCGGTTCPYTIPTPANLDCDGKGIHLFGARVEIKGPCNQDWIIVVTVPYSILSVNNTVLVPMPEDGTFAVRHCIGEYGIVVADDPTGVQKNSTVNWSDPSDPVVVYVKDSKPAKPAQGYITPQA